MNNEIKTRFAERAKDFRLPLYSELPNVGLYLEQVTKYINGILVPLGFSEMTPYMISNYVKKGIIDAPVKKQYFAEHIAYLLFVGAGKSIVSMDEICYIYGLQKKLYSCDVAYDYFCLELENTVKFNAGLKSELESVGTTNTELKDVLQNLISCIAHLLFVNSALEQFRERENSLENN